MQVRYTLGVRWRTFGSASHEDGDPHPGAAGRESSAGNRFARGIASRITPAQRAFTPSAEELAAAKHIVDAYEQNVRAGRGAFALDGKMVELPIVKAAQRVLARGGQ